jgi:hypothetical protein
MSGVVKSGECGGTQHFLFDLSTSLGNCHEDRPLHRDGDVGCALLLVVYLLMSIQLMNDGHSGCLKHVEVLGTSNCPFKVVWSHNIPR